MVRLLHSKFLNNLSLVCHDNDKNCFGDHMLHRQTQNVPNRKLSLIGTREKVNVPMVRYAQPRLGCLLTLSSPRGVARPIILLKHF